MAQIAANPWSFTTADQATSAAITSITNQGRSALVTTTAAHGLLANAQISIQGTTVTGWRGGYIVQAVPSTTTLLIQDPNLSSLANNGANGNVLTAAYLQKIRIEQLLWDSPTAAAVCTLTDVAGNQIYNVTAGIAAGTPGPYTYGKLFWVNGLVINALPNGTLQLTIN